MANRGFASVTLVKTMIDGIHRGLPAAGFKRESAGARLLPGNVVDLGHELLTFVGIHGQIIEYWESS
jgi:hypothetical protein